MKIKYEFADGTVSEVEVEESIGAVIIEDRRLEDNLARKERYHCHSLDAVEFEGADYGTDETPETLLAAMEEDRRVYEAFHKLSEVQQRRLTRQRGAPRPPGAASRSLGWAQLPRRRCQLVSQRCGRAVRRHSWP